MEDLWKRARVFAEEAARKSQTRTSSSNSKLADLVAETAKKSKELAAEASKKADQLRAAAIKQADQITSLSDIHLSSLITAAAAELPVASGAIPDESELRQFGVTDDLRDFVNGLTSATFQHFPVQDEAVSEETEVTGSNVRKDLTEWQERHATLVLATVKPITRLRYELCPRAMKERRFWRIYFTLVSTHVAPYEKQYMEEKRREEERMKVEKAKQAPTPAVALNSETNEKSKTSNASTVEQDLDSFLLGDLEDSDGGGPDEGDGSFDDDDFDKIDNSDVEDEKHPKKAAPTAE